jgi:hypothetical protein
LLALFPAIFIVCGKVNFTNLSRYSDLSERTYRRHYGKSYDFLRFNAESIKLSTDETAETIAVMDCSFLSKSGKKTHGLGYFYNGTTGRAEKGLEISLISMVDVEQGQGYGLSVQQTPADCALKPPGKTKTQTETSRIDHYLAQLRKAHPRFAKTVTILAVDGFYAKKKFIDGVLALNLAVVGKLRIDANLRYLYTGVQKNRGARRKYDGKVDLSDPSRFTWVGEVEPDVKLYTAVVWHMSLKRLIRIAYLIDQSHCGKPRHALLFSSNVTLSALDIVRYYKARFQIEFIFREAKQFTGLADCQSTQEDKLDFHLNASISALNIAKLHAYQQHLASENRQDPFVFSMASYKRRALNEYLLQQFISMLELDSSLIKSHPNFQKLCSLGMISP